MKKLSQKELLEEGFGSMVKGLARGAAGLAKGTAKMISPTASKIVKSAADKVGAAIGNALSSPTLAIKDHFSKPEVKSKYDNLIIGKETKLNNFRRQIELEFRDVRKGEQVKTTAEAYRTDEGGTSPETWSFEKIKTPSGDTIGTDSVEGDNKKDTASNFEVGSMVKWQTSRGHIRVGKISNFKQQDDGREDAIIVYKDDNDKDRKVALSPDKLTILKDKPPITEKSQKSLLKHLQSMSS